MELEYTSVRKSGQDGPCTGHVPETAILGQPLLETGAVAHSTYAWLKGVG